MEAADFEQHFYRDGVEVTPPALTGDEDHDIALYEDFLLSDGVTVQDRCTADNSLVVKTHVGTTETARCREGHRWVYLFGRSGEGWRQVA